MIKFIKKLIKFILPYGVIKILHRSDPKLKIFEKQFKDYSLLLKDNRFECRWEDIYPCLFEATESTSFDSHYIYHPAWAARIIAGYMPEKHIDISSSLNFISLISAFVPVQFYDYRPAKIILSGLECKKGDLLNLPFEDRSVKSISCMHVVEHVGLGRYGDPIDPKGDLKAIGELIRVVAKNGQLLFVVPIGKESRIQFNAHRIYTYQSIINAFHELSLVTFSLITDSGDFIDNADKRMADDQKYGCGCFCFKREA